MNYNGFVAPAPNAALPEGMRIFAGQYPSDERPKFIYQVQPVVADDHFQMNLGGTVPSSWTMNQIAHYVDYMRPDDSVFTERAVNLLRARGYDF